MSIIKPKNIQKETIGISLFPVFAGTSFASFVGKLSSLASKISPSFQHNAVDFWFDIRYFMR